MCTTAEKCNFPCNSVFNKANGACIATQAHCTKKPFALFQNFQTTKNGERAVTVASLGACSAYCRMPSYASFDWDGNQCGI